MDQITLDPAVPDDVAWIVSQEAREDFAAFIHRWSAESHRANLDDPDYRYFVVRGADGLRLGYVILRGLMSPAHSLELVRIVSAEPGKGLGKRVLREVIRLAFAALGANRLWLDVFDDNERGRRAYRAVGFVEEGVLRDAALRSDGRLGSLVIMSILAAEYRTR